MYKFKETITKLLIVLLLLGIVLSPPFALATTTISNSNISISGNLTVNGGLQFTSGAVNNYILKTDATGNATWISVGTALSTWAGSANITTLGTVTSAAGNVSLWTNNAGYLTAETDPSAVLKATFAANGDLLVGTGAGTYSALTAGVGNNGKVLTVSGGVPGWSAVSYSETDPLALKITSNLSDVNNSTTAFNNIAPSQGGNNSKFLTTDGTNASWATALTAETDPLAILKATITANGDLIVGTGAGTYSALAAGVGNNGKVLTVSGGVPGWASILTLPTGTTDNSTLRYDTGTSTWQENTNILASSAGDVAASGGFKSKSTYYSPYVLYKNTTSGSITGSGYRTVVSFSVPANTLNGNVLVLDIQTRRTTGSGNLTWQVVYGGTTCFTTPAYTTSYQFPRLWIIGTGASSQTCNMITGANGVNGTAAVDSTQAQTLTVQADLASDTDVFTFDMALGQVMQ